MIQEILNNIQKVYKKIYLIPLALFVLFSTLVYASFTFSQSAWQNTQNYDFEGGTGQERVTGEFTSNAANCGGAGTMYDTLTNLCWEQNPSTGIFTWSNAVTHCEDLTTAGGGWRLPEKAELMTLLFHNGVSSTHTKLNSIGFSGIQNSWYWSNTRYSLDPSTAYIVHFGSGLSYHNFVTPSGHVLCVKTAS